MAEAIVTLWAKTRIVCTSMHIENFYSYLWNYACYWKIFTRIDGASNLQRKLQINKNYISFLLAWLWKVLKPLFCFCSLNSECVTGICLQCGKRKQNHCHFLGKTASIDKRAVILRIFSITYSTCLANHWWTF